MVENTCSKTSETNTAQETARSSSTTYEADHPVQFTGIVVTYNEARHLRDCLNSLAFCEQLIVIDLGSTDASVEIARQCGAEVIHRERVPIVEQIWGEATAYARNDWIVILDPDEVLPSEIENDLRPLIRKSPNPGMIAIPILYYFRGKPLYCTRWGGIRAFPKVFHKRRVEFPARVHRGRHMLDDYTAVALPRRSADYYIKHYWADSYRQLFEKHWRYIQHEGESRYDAGKRFSWKRAVYIPLTELRRNLINLHGTRGGWTGIFLSLFWAWYVFMRELSLWCYQRRAKVRGI